MSTRSSRFSSLSSSTAKSFQPPKPTFNSPKLLQEGLATPSSSHDTPTFAHPFNSATYGARRRAPTLPEPYQPARPVMSSNSQPAHLTLPSEFGELPNDTDSLNPHSMQSDTHGRRRSSTLGSHHITPAELMSIGDALLTPNPFKSHFDDSEDEEKVQVASKSLGGVSHRARLAAIGTASRLFKGRRHSRTSSSSLASNLTSPDSTAPLRIEKESRAQRDTPLSRPSTSDGMTSLPRQAVFGHRPSPSELSLSSRSQKARSIAPADRDLILGLKGTTLKPTRPKPSDRDKILSMMPNALRQSPNVSASTVIEAKAHWIYPPPYSAADGADLNRRESLRKSHSLSTLRFDPGRRPRQPSPVSELEEPRACVPASRPVHADRSAWEAMLTDSPSTVSDHSSLSSCGRITRTELIPDYPPRRPPKSQRLPPQKPPPQFDLPPPPIPTFETPSSIATTDIAQQDDESPSAVSAPSPHETSTSPSDFSASKSLPSPPAPSLHSQVELNVGGTRFVTLVSTLQGTSGDEPRLIDNLQLMQPPQLSGSNAPLCSDTHLVRRKRVDASQRLSRERSHSHSPHSSQDSGAASPVYTTVDESSAAERLTAQLDTVLGLGWSEAVSQSSTSLETCATGSASRTESEASTRRTSDNSSASSVGDWSKCTQDAGEHDATQTKPSDASPLSPPHALLLRSDSAQTEAKLAAAIFLDRNADPYRDLLDILRAAPFTLPYRLQATSITVDAACASYTCCGSDMSTNAKASCMAALRLQLRCRLHEVKAEAAWLGYASIVALCERELSLV